MFHKNLKFYRLKKNMTKKELAFKLPFTYLMNGDAVEDELLNPPGLGEDLVRHGLQKIELTEEEFYLAEEYVVKSNERFKND